MSNYYFLFVRSLLILVAGYGHDFALSYEYCVLTYLFNIAWRYLLFFGRAQAKLGTDGKTDKAIHRKTYGDIGYFTHFTSVGNVNHGLFLQFGVRIIH